VKFTNKHAGALFATRGSADAITILLPADAPAAVTLSTADTDKVARIFDIKRSS
jgi:hypothetical protein